MARLGDGQVRTDIRYSSRGNTVMRHPESRGEWGTPYQYADQWGPYTYISERKDRARIAGSAIDETGWRPPNSYEAEGSSFVPLTGSGRCTKKSYGNYMSLEASGNFWNFNGSPYTHIRAYDPTIPAIDYPNWLTQRAINRALVDLKDSHVNYAVALAESRKAADLVASTARSIAGALRDIRKGRMKDAASRFGLSRKNFRDTFKLYKGKRGFDRQMSKRWLELQYGWTPLLSDVHGAFQDLNKGFLREPRFAVTKTSKHTVEYSRASNQPPYTYWRGTDRCRGEFLCKVRLDYVLDARALQTLSQKGLTNPSLIAWELLPWSFVADWFVPVQEYLSTLDAALGVSFKSGTITRYEKRSVETNLQVVSQYSFDHGTLHGSRSEWNVTRTVLNKPPSSGLYFKNPFSAQHAISALALLNTAVNLKRK